MANIIARSTEQSIFDDILQKEEAAFVALYGRRRIGKTFLVEQYFKDKGLFFHLLGIEKAKLKSQLTNFANEFAASFSDGTIQDIPETWLDAFNLLQQKIKSLKNSQKKVILFFDELPWLASPRSGFLQALEHCWNRYLCNMPNVILIVCGSAASWMIKNIVNNKGGLHGRINYKINLKPFNLHETELFLNSRNIQLNRKQLVDLYMCIGGVAQYLKYVRRGLSSEQNINNLCFQSRGELYYEFDNLYRSLFKNHTAHISVVRSLSKSRQGLEYDEIAEITKIPSGGGLSDILKELSAADFILPYQTISPSKKVTKYRLTDEFTLFYITWCEKHRDLSIADDDPEYWQKQHNSPAWRSWSGYSFEGICLKHLTQIKQALGISGVKTQSYKWVYQPEDSNFEGAEIDVLIDRNDQCINLFEIKYYDDEFVIDKAYAKQLRKKKMVYMEQTKTKKTIFMTLMTTYGAKKNEHFLGLIDKQLTINDLFE
jgi:uncharacterized protein